MFHVRFQPCVSVGWLPCCSCEDLNSRILPIRQRALLISSPHVPSTWFSQSRTHPDRFRGEITSWSQLGALENSPHSRPTMISRTEYSPANILMAISAWDALHYWGFLIVSHMETCYDPKDQEHKDISVRDGFRQYSLAMLQTSYLVIPWRSRKCRGKCQSYHFMKNAHM